MALPDPRVLTGSRSFEAVLTGSHALVRAMMESRTRAAVFCSDFPVPGVAELLRALPEKSRSYTVRPPAGERSAIRAAVRTAMDGNLTALLCGNCGHTALEVLVPLRNMEIRGGMVMVVVTDSEPGSRGDHGQKRYAAFEAGPEPESPGQVYRFYKSAAIRAAANRTLGILRLSSRICHASEKITCEGIVPIEGREGRPEAALRSQGQAAGPKRYQAVICPGCGHRPAADMIAQVLAANGVPVSAMGCHTFEYQAFLQPGDVLFPASGCRAQLAGLGIEDRDRNLTAYIGDRRFFREGLRCLTAAGPVRENMTLILVESPGPDPGAESGSMDAKRQVVRHLGIDRVLSCEPCRPDNLIPMVREAMAFQGPAAVISTYLPDRG